MMADDHLLVGAYALGALEHDEQRAFEAHLERCAACRTEVAELTGTAALLAVAVAVPAPVSEPLFERVMSQVRVTPQQGPPANRNGEARGSHPSRPSVAAPAAGGAVAPRRHRSAGARSRRWLAAAAVVVLALLAGTMVTRLAGERSRSTELAALASDPGARHHVLRGDGPGEVRVHVRADNGRASVEARDLPALDSSRTYELWFMAGGNPYRAADFAPDGSGSAAVLFTPPVAGADAFGVTIEPAGGRDRPTLPIVLQAQA